MSQNPTLSPWTIFLIGLVLGVIGGFIFAQVWGREAVVETTIFASIIKGAAQGAFYSFLYYLLFKNKVADVSQTLHERNKFATVYFLWVGCFLGLEAMEYVNGKSLFEVAAAFFFVVIFLTFVYRKLFNLYQVANKKTGEGSPPSAS